ncbi:MAG: transcriptional regulator, MarR family [Chloroflexi bacterium]|jgi:DNA-binding MarR family transcriptional regulator|nr:transcriptional regulator, MarR family [Chloroflexota bacterium]
MELQHDRLVAEALDAFKASWSALRQSTEPSWTHLDLSISQLKVLFILDSQGTLSISELATKLFIGRPSSSILVEQLVERQLVRRTEDPADRRRSLVQLTAYARDLIANLYYGNEIFTRQWFERLANEDLAALARGLYALLQASMPARAEAAVV